MAGVLQHLRSSTLNKRPNPASMVDGQIAINYASGSPGAFFKDTNGNLVKVGPVHVGTTAPNVSPASGGTAGNSLGEQWLDTSGGTYVFKIWDGAAWRSEAGEFVNSTGDTMTGSLTMGPSANLIFEGSVDDGFETTLTVVNPTADRTITLPNVSGTVITTGDSGTVTSTMIADGTIVNADVNASAAIAGTKISPDFGSQTIQTTGVFSHAVGSAGAPTITFAGDNNTGIYSPGADQVAISTGGSGRVFVDASGRVGIGTTSPGELLSLYKDTNPFIGIQNSTTGTASTDGGYVGMAGLLMQITNKENAPIAFLTNNTEAARIDSSGRLLVGTSSARGSMGARLQLEAAGAGAAEQLSITYNGDNSVGAYLELGKTRGTTVGSNTAVINGDELGAINFMGANGTDLRANIGARISAVVDAEPFTSGDTTDLPSRLVFSTTADGASSPTERMRITSAGNVGIGTTDPVEKLEVRDGNIGLDSAGSTVGNRTTERFYKRTDNGSTNGMAAIGMNGAGTNGFLGEIKFYTGTSDVFSASLSERARIDSSGRLLVGTGTAISTAALGAAQVQVVGTDNTTSQLAISRFSNDADRGRLTFIKSRGSSGTNTIVQADDAIGRIEFIAADGSGSTAYPVAAHIGAFVDGTPGANDMPGRLVFSTTADGASSPTERMRITQAGNINIATAGSAVNVSTGSIDGVTFYGATGTIDGVIQASNNTAPVALFRRRTNDGSVISFYRDTTGVGSISVTTTATAYNTSSDYRLKENVVAVTDGITRLQQLKPSRFNFIADPDKTVDGFLAHEVQTVVPEAISGEKDAVDDEGNPQYQGIDQSKLVPLLTAALQEAVAKIESLEARLTAAGL